METIEYLINKENQKITLKNILNDWDLNGSELSDADKLDFLLYVEEKSKMVYSVLGESFNSESDIDLYTDICLQPQNLLYTTLPFEKNISITISMNEIKAFIVDVAFTLFCLPGISLEKIQIVVIKLLVLLIKCSSIISDDIEKCVLKSIVLLSQNGNAVEKDIFALFDEEYFCPIFLKKCMYFRTEMNKCCLAKEKRNNLIQSALDKLTINKVITVKDSEQTDKREYCISRFILK